MSEELLKVRKHGIDIPNWMWNMVEEGQIRTPETTTKSAYVRRSLIEQAKRDKIWPRYKKFLAEMEVLDGVI